MSAPACHWTDGTRLDLAAVGEAARSVGARLVFGPFPESGDGLLRRRCGPARLRGVRRVQVAAGPSGGCRICGLLRRTGEEGRSTATGCPGRAAMTFPGCTSTAGSWLPERGVTTPGSPGTSGCPKPPARIGDRDGSGKRTLVGPLPPPHRPSGRRVGVAGAGCSPPRVPQRSLGGLRLPEGADPRSLVEELADRSVFVSVRGNSVRVSAHMWNTPADIDRLLEGLAAWVG